MNAAVRRPRHSRSRATILRVAGRLVWTVLTGLLVDPSRAGAVVAPVLLSDMPPVTAAERTQPMKPSGSRHNHPRSAPPGTVPKKCAKRAGTPASGPE